MSFLKVPESFSLAKEAHIKWLSILSRAEELLDEDIQIQIKAEKGLMLKERRLPPEVLGKFYALYCKLINDMYDAYLNSIHLQRSPYILEIVSVFVKRLYEIRNELVHFIVNDYVYVDTALRQMHMTPYDIQIVVPYHTPLESRSDTIEGLLQTMWSDAIRRKNNPPREGPRRSTLMKSSLFQDVVESEEQSEEESEEYEPPEVVEATIPKAYLHAVMIQKNERFRQFYMEDFLQKCQTRRTYFAVKGEPVSYKLKKKAAVLIQRVYREFMRTKRQRAIDSKRDKLLGIIPDPFKPRLNYEEENNKVYSRRRRKREELTETLLREMEREKARLIMIRKDDQIDDITDQIREWFKEWYYGYQFFPQYPYITEGGTLMVMYGDYPTVEEKIEEDEKIAAATKGKTKEQLQQEKQQAAADAKMKSELLKEQKKKEAENLFKMRCNPLVDPGYKIQKSVVTDAVTEALQRYRAMWSIHDKLPPDQCGSIIYGYFKPFLTEELMCEMHKDCRKFVDQLMRLDLKLLIKMQQKDYKFMGWKFPKTKPRKMPKAPPVRKPLIIDYNLTRGFEQIFDLFIVTKPTVKLKDVVGDLNFAAYELNLQDPDVKYPPPGYGDVKMRVLLSCVFGSGIEAGAKRNKSVMLLGPEKNGKTFLADAVAGELNAIKIDISPELFSSTVKKAGKALTQVFLIARTFQPAIIYIRNVERLFYKKIPPEQKVFKPKALKGPLTKMLKSLSLDDKIMFIGTCSNPFVAKAKPLVSIFSEMILIPRTDYGSIRLFLQDKFQRLRSMPPDYCVQAIAQILRGYSFGVIVALYNEVMTPERIVRLNVTPLSPSEFLEPLLENQVEPMTIEEYKKYEEFFINNSYLSQERKEYNIINFVRAEVYKKLEKIEAAAAQT